MKQAVWLQVWLVLSGCLLTILCAAPMDAMAQGMMVMVLLSLLWISRVSSISEQSEVARMITLTVGVFLSLRYLVWRGLYTLTAGDPISYILTYLLFAAELYAGLMHILGCMVNATPLKRKPLRLSDLPPDTVLPSVDVFVPSYNEDAAMLEVTLRAALGMRYPADKLRVHLLDDGGTDQKIGDSNPEKAAQALERRVELTALCDRLGAIYITREKNLHAKAGNINEAIPKTQGDLIVILDADHVPALDFLDRTVPWMVRDDKVFLVQTPHFMVNPDPIDRNLLQSFRRMPSENDMFYLTIQRGLDFWASSFFCGSAAVLRRRYLVQIGGICGTTITEDAESALEMHSLGYKSVYVDQPLVAGLAPETFTGFVIQRMRWAQGMTQILLLKRPFLKRGLHWFQKVGYMSSLMFWLFPFARITFLLSPLAYLCLGLGVYNASISEILAYTVPHVIASYTVSSLLFGRTRWPLVSELYEMMQCVFSLNAIIQVLRNPHKPSFIVTPKGESLEDEFISPLSTPFYVLLILVVLGYIIGGWRWHAYVATRDLTTVVLVWNTINFLTILAGLGALLERRQRRATPRMPAQEKGTFCQDNDAVDKAVHCEVDDLSVGGARLLIDRKLTAPKRGDILNLSIFSHPLQRTITVRGEVRATFPVAGRFTGIGLCFLKESEQAANDIVMLAYGDSNRWAFFQERRCRSIPFTTAFLLVLSLIWKPVLDHLKMLWKQILTTIRFPARPDGKNAASHLAVILFCGAALWSLGGHPAAAATSKKAVTAQTIPQVSAPIIPTIKGDLPLSEFYGNSNPLRLQDSIASANLYVPLAPAMKMADAILDLSFTNSVALAAGRSVLSVRLNETTMAQIALDPRQPMGSASLRLPKELWHPGYNKLTLDVTQHTSEACEDPHAPELWTEVDLSQSKLHYEIQPQDHAPRLSDLSGIFAPGIGGQNTVSILTAPGEAGDIRSRALPLAAQALAMRRQFAPLTFHHSEWRIPGSGHDGYLPEAQDHPGLHVLLGTPDQLAAILPAVDQPVVDGPRLIIQKISAQSSRLIITGRTANEVIIAARQAAIMDDALNPGNTVTVTGMPIGQVRSHYLEDTRIHRFTELGQNSTTVTGTGTFKIDVPLTLPPDFYTDESAQAEVALDFAYSAGLERGSTANVTINGTFVHGLLLDNQDGQAFHHYRLNLPIREMRAGVNHLTIDTMMQAHQNKSECHENPGRNLQFQLLESSTIKMPAAGHAVMLPNLSLMTMSGFPYVNINGTESGALVVARPDLIGPALTLIGKIAQQANGIGEKWRLMVGDPGAIPDQALYLAANDDIPPTLFKDWTVALGRTKLWPYRALNEMRDAYAGRHLDLGLLNPLGEDADDFPSEKKTGGSSVVSVSQRSSLGDMGVIMGLHNPNTDHPRIITIVSAETDDLLTKRVDDLVSSKIWSQIHGDLATWTGQDDTVFAMDVTDRFEYGKHDRLLLLRLSLTNNPWYWLGGVLAGLGVFITSAILLLRRRRRSLEG